MRRAVVQAALDQCGDEVDIDQFLERVYLLRKLELAEQDIEQDRTVDHDEAKRRLARWLD